MESIDFKKISSSSSTNYQPNLLKRHINDPFHPYNQHLSFLAFNLTLLFKQNIPLVINH